MKKIILITMLFLSISTAFAAVTPTDAALNNLVLNGNEALRIQEGTTSVTIQLNVDNSPYGVIIDDDEMTIKEGKINSPYMEIDTTTADLEKVNILLQSYNEDQKLSFTEKLTMWKLMFKYNLNDDIQVYIENEVSANMKLW